MHWPPPPNTTTPSPAKHTHVPTTTAAAFRAVDKTKKERNKTKTEQQQQASRQTKKTKKQKKIKEERKKNNNNCNKCEEEKRLLDNFYFTFLWFLLLLLFNQLNKPPSHLANPPVNKLTNQTAQKFNARPDDTKLILKKIDAIDAEAKLTFWRSLSVDSSRVVRHDAQTWWRSGNVWYLEVNSLWGVLQTDTTGRLLHGESLTD